MKHNAFVELEEPVAVAGSGDTVLIGTIVVVIIA